MIASTKVIDWDSILEKYGTETQRVLRGLISEAELQDDDPAAIILAALFLTQVETTEAYQKLSSVIDSGKNDLSEQFKNQVEQMRGIISFAQEHLVEGGKQEIAKREEALLDVVKQGISRAIGNHNRSSSARNTSFVAGVVAATFVVSLLSFGAGGLGVYWMRPRTLVASADSDNQALIEWAQSADGQNWLAIINENSDRLQTCLENKIELNNKCSITIP